MKPSSPDASKPDKSKPGRRTPAKGKSAITEPSRHLSSGRNALQQAIHEEDVQRLDLARRLHKDVAGNLVACTALSEMIRHQWSAEETGQNGVSGTLAQIEKALRDTLQIVRTLTEEQFPPVLTAFGLSAALQQFVKHMVGGFTGALILHVDEDELKLDPLRRLGMFRLLQLMIRRCVCDARASVVEVSFVAVNGQINCTIDHDGNADLWSGAGNTNELAVIEARCALLGGTFHASPTAPGTTSRAILSIPRHSPAANA